MLVWGVLGLLESQKVCLAEWGAVIQSRARLASSHQRRFVRWLNNPHVDVQAYYAPLIQSALAGWPKRQRLYLALDTSPRPHGLMMVQVVWLYRGRAIPLNWRVLEHGSVMIAYPVYAPLLQEVCCLLAGYEQIELSADRGFFNGKLLEFCLTQRWHFRLRATRDTLVVDEMGRVSTLARLCPPTDAVTFYPNVQLMHQQIGPVHLALAHPTWDRADPWYVVSDEVTTLATFDE